VDFEQGLNNAMKRLRAALDDDAESPRFIETLPRRGDRFIGPVRGSEPTPATVASDDQTGSATANLAEECNLQSELFLAYHYMLGQGHLLAHHGKDAAEEFQKIIDHRGIIPNFLLSTLAHLGLARAYVLQGDTSKGRAAYEEFFARCETGASCASVVRQAKVEYTRPC
jgi:hypothetical protein